MGASAYAWPPEARLPLAPAGAIHAAEPFPVPPQLRSAVYFWRDIFTRHGSDRVVLHDRENMDVVWRVVELPKDEHGVVDERQVRTTVRRAVEEVKRELQRLEKDPVAKTHEDRVLLALAGGDKSRFEGAAERLRTQRGVADHFQAGLVRAQQWVSDVRNILKREHVPEEIAVLPFVESMYNPLARSSAGAAGLWQLMPGTARSLGLHVSRSNDQRLDVQQATRAAARVLRQNYRMLGSWPLAITAYNHGPYGVQRAVQTVGSTDLVQLIEGYEKSTWGFSSKNFYAEFLAALSIMNELAESDAALAFTDASGSPSVRN